MTFVNAPIKSLIDFEKARLRKLLFNWLNYEAERKPFKVVANEQWQTVKINQLTLHVQIDRIDEVAPGQHVLIDYKTGLSNINDWFGDRPNQPQMPLYTVTHQQPIKAIAFAQLRPNDMRFKGVSIDKDELPHCRPLSRVPLAFNDWEDQLSRWQATLNRLANAFLQGDAAVDPKNPRQTCKHCHLKTLCRV